MKALLSMKPHPRLALVHLLSHLKTDMHTMVTCILHVFEGVAGARRIGWRRERREREGRRLTTGGGGGLAARKYELETQSSQTKALTGRMSVREQNHAQPADPQGRGHPEHNHSHASLDRVRSGVTYPTPTYDHLIKCLHLCEIYFACCAPGR